MQNDIRTLVDDFATRLEQIIRRTALEQVEGALGANLGGPARRGPGRPPKAATVKRAAKVTVTARPQPGRLDRVPQCSR